MSHFFSLSPQERLSISAEIFSVDVLLFFQAFQSARKTGRGALDSIKFPTKSSCTDHHVDVLYLSGFLSQLGRLQIGNNGETRFAYCEILSRNYYDKRFGQFVCTAVSEIIRAPGSFKVSSRDSSPGVNQSNKCGVFTRR